MKKSIKLLTTVIAGLALTLGLSITSCSKSEAGPKGDTGPQGATGNANVQSFTVTPAMSSWTLSAGEWDCDLTSSLITQTVLDKGAVMAYVSTGSSFWVAMPVSLSNQTYAFGIDLNLVSFAYTDGTSTPPSPVGLKFKVVVIPPAYMKKDVNLLDYNEVKEAYNLD